MRTLLQSTALATILSGLMSVSPAMAQVAPGQLPFGGQVVDGIFTISVDGPVLTIDQTSAEAVADWSSFDIGVGAEVTILQPAEMRILNLVSNGNQTQIDGMLDAGGTVFLLNPDGIGVNASGQVNVGNLLLTTLSVDPADFMGGTYAFDAGGETDLVINSGWIDAFGGSATLLGGAVDNGGVIRADSGTINLVAADRVTADPGPAGVQNILITRALQAQRFGSAVAITNSGVLTANNGTVNLRASAAPGVFGTLITNAGTINATGGRIELNAVGGGIINIGSLDAGNGQIFISTTGGFQSSGSRPIVAGTVAGAISGDAFFTGGNEIGNLSWLSVGGDFHFTNAVDLSQIGAISVGGTTEINAGSGSITLTHDNDFAGAVSLSGNDISVRDINGLTIASLQSGVDGAVSLVAGGTLILPPHAIDTGAGDLTLESRGGPLGTSAALGGGDVSLFGRDGVTLGHGVAASGELSISTLNAYITQTGGALQAGGITSIDAGSGSIMLTNVGNDFTGAVSLSGNGISVRGINYLTIASLQNAANSAVDLRAEGTLTLASQTIDTGVAELTLVSNGGALATAGALRGAGISLTGMGSLSLNDNVTATGVLALTSDNAITQAAGALTASQLVIDGGSASLMAAGNAIATLGTVDLSGDFSLRNGSAVSLAGDLTAGGAVDFFMGVTVGSGRTISAQETTMHNGLLQVDGQIDGSVRINSGATLGGGGTVGSTVVADGGRLSPGASIGMLSVAGDLTLGSGSVLDYELGSPGAAAGVGTSDTIAVRDHLTLDGTLNLAQSGDPADGIAGIGYYRLMTYGTLDDQELIIGARPVADIDYNLLLGGGNVDLYIGNIGHDSLQHWQGGDGAWNATDAMWLNQNGTLPANWAGNHAAFRNEPGGFDGGTVGVEGTQDFLGLQFVDNGFVLAGPGRLQTASGDSEIRVLANVGATVETEITGTGGIVKTHDGTLVLAGTNTYTGGTQLSGGTLSVSSDANLGASSGGLAFTGGTLAAAASFASGRAVTLDALGRFDVLSGTTLSLDGAIAGPGDLLKSGEGDLVLSGSNAYGNTLLEAGTLIGNTSSISGSIGNAGTVVFDQAANASFAGDIAGFSGTDGAMIKEGGGILTLTGTSLLDWRVEGGGLVSATDRFGGNLVIETDGAFTFDQAASGIYAGAVSGTGDLFFTGGGMVELTGDSSGFAGLTEVAGTTLFVNEALGGSALIGAGGVLSGSGTLGGGIGSTITLASGSTLAPGNSIGTLIVDGDLVLDAGSRYEVEVMPGGADSDLVAVSGTATLNGGTAAHIGMTGAYDPTATYTILTAAGGVSGEFADVTSDFAFLDSTLGYGGNAVTLTLTRNDTGFADVGETRNQIATASGVDSLTFGNDLYDAFVQLDAPTARTALDQLSGEIHASVAGGLIENSTHIRDAANDRIRAAFESVGASATPVLAYGPDGPVLAPASDGLGVSGWGRAFGSWGSTESNGNAASLDRSTGGLIVGADGLLADGWRAGLLAGYSRSAFTVDGRASSANSDNYHLGAYAGTQWAMPEGDLALRTGLAYTWHDIETNRAVGFTGFTDSLSGDYDAATFQAFGELGYAIETGIAAFEPFVNLAHVSLRTGGFTEQGGAAALTSADPRIDTTFTTLGLRAQSDMVFGDRQATASGMVGWRHAFGDTTPLATHGFAGGDAFTVAGNPIAKNALVLEAGLDLDLTPDASLGFSYRGQIAADAQDHGFNIRLGVSF